MRIYSLIMSISISCGSGKGNEDVSGGQTTSETIGETTLDPSGPATATETPTTGVPDPDPSTDTSMTTTTTTAAPSTGPGDTTEADASSTGTVSESATDTEDDGQSTGSSGGESSAGETGGEQNVAKVNDECAPDDGAALEFQIGVDMPGCGGSFVGDLRIRVYQGAPLVPGDYPIDLANGIAVFNDGSGELLSESGTLTIDGWRGSEVSGSYQVVFEDQSVAAGLFVAEHCLTMPLCG
jgi:hypothetical protein